MVELTFTPVVWKQTPELAWSFYRAFPWRDKRDLRGHVDDDEQMWIAAYNNSRLASAMCVRLYPYDNGTYIDWLFTTKSFLRQGCATQMVENALEWFGPLCLTVGEYNKKAVDFYKSLGFQQYDYFHSMQGKILWLKLDK